MYVEQCPMRPFIPIFLIGFGISFGMVYFGMCIVVKTKESDCCEIVVPLCLFQAAWLVAGQFISYMHC